MNKLKRFPLVAFALSSLLSAPFLVGWLKPSIHEGIFPAIYVLLNWPFIKLYNNLTNRISPEMISRAYIESDTTVILFCIVIWTLLGLAFGVLAKIKDANN